MGKTIVVTNRKGGCGKSFTTASLSVGLARQGKKVLCIDADNQHSLTVSLGITEGNRQYAGNPFDVGWLPYVTSYYGYRVHPITGAKDLHRGVDIALPAGTEIRSTQEGTVTFAGYSGGYGNVVIIEKH